MLRALLKAGNCHRCRLQMRFLRQSRCRIGFEGCAFGFNPMPSTVNGFNLFLPRLRGRSCSAGLPSTVLFVPFSVIRVRRYLNGIRAGAFFGRAMELRVCTFFAGVLRPQQQHRINEIRKKATVSLSHRMLTACIVAAAFDRLLRHVPANILSVVIPATCPRWLCNFFFV